MNKANQIQFKAELELDLKSPEDIQKWALDILESNPSVNGILKLTPFTLQMAK